MNILLLAANWGLIITLGATVVIAVLIAFAVIKSLGKDKQRTETLEDIAKKMGWEFNQYQPEMRKSLVETFSYFKDNERHPISNVIKGQANGADINIFDHMHRYTIVYFRSDKLNLPQFSLSPEKTFSKIGRRDIDFETHPEFSKFYTLSGEDEQRIRQIFGREILSYYEQNPGRMIFAAGDKLVLLNETTAPENIKNLLDESVKTLERFSNASRNHEY